MEFKEFVSQGVTLLLFGLVWWRVEKHLNKLAERETEMEEKIESERHRFDSLWLANNKGTQALLRDRLLQGFHFFKKRGVVTYGEASSYKNMYEAYHALGKNGVMDGIYEEFLKIPVRSDAEVYPNE